MALRSAEDLPREKKRRTVSLRLLLIFGFGGLVALSVGGVLALSVYANFANTHSLLNRQADLTIEAMERTFVSDAEEAERSVQAVGALYEQGAFELNDRESEALILRPLLLSEPVIENLVIISNEGVMTGLIRHPRHEELLEAKTPPGKRAAPPKDLFKKNSETRWTKPLKRDGILFHSVIHPLTRNGKIVGMVSAAVGPFSLNRIVRGIGSDSNSKTIILNHDYELIAHSTQPELFRGKASIGIKDIADPTTRIIAAKILELGLRDRAEADSFRITETLDEGSREYIVMTKAVAAMSEQPYVLAAFFDAANLSSELERARIAAIVGLVAFVLAVAMAVFFGNRLSKPLTRVADAASRFARLDLASHKQLPVSRVREIDGQARAMNAMHTALSQFGQYVPKELVRRLMQSGTQATRSVEREITVMFTDVAGFTAMSEHMGAGDVVKVLNEHFETLCGQISKHSGTVDKFMGDGLMAFWGAPEADPDHARNAIEAARGIMEAFDAENRTREGQGLEPLKLRVGIHTGRAVIGNIGGSDRQNYTVVGDIVNVASRLEQLGKEMIEDRSVCVLISSQCRISAGDPSDLVPAGSHMLRGRKRPISVFALQIRNSGRDAPYKARAILS
ncbi:adenylate/guanylate cyclase domain-containing protein [Hoeflea poritis]|uniref:HAMP domain-containing protein n=1 Tax=Hoeflea poritis TaxID=2993659 RepID=A0ABT4VQW2_9HYPH|nr:adenylate/guanylate cyclase domain-containing protein [Hoeflea poritis]MDA4847081.1 HAMP domain-containing protein [Hoeflea poritis]